MAYTIENVKEMLVDNTKGNNFVFTGINTFAMEELKQYFNSWKAKQVSTILIDIKKDDLLLLVDKTREYLSSTSYGVEPIIEAFILGKIASGLRNHPAKFMAADMAETLTPGIAFYEDFPKQKFSAKNLTELESKGLTSIKMSIDSAVSVDSPTINLCVTNVQKISEVALVTGCEEIVILQRILNQTDCFGCLRVRKFFFTEDGALPTNKFRDDNYKPDVAETIKQFTDQSVDVFQRTRGLWP